MNIKFLQEQHDRHNEAYILAKTEHMPKPGPLDEKWKAIAGERLDKLNDVLASVSIADLNESPYVEAIDCLVSFFDDIVLECALLTERRGETEEKILNLCKDALNKPSEAGTRDSKNEHVAALLIDGLVLHEVPLVLRAQSINAALLNDTNPMRLGLVLYGKFCAMYPEFANRETLEYIKAEEEARFLLATGQNAAAADVLARMFELPVNSSEKFLLVALNSFCCGFTEDAKHALRLGLTAFPGNKRLLNARAGLDGL